MQLISRCLQYSQLVYSRKKDWCKVVCQQNETATLHQRRDGHCLWPSWFVVVIVEPHTTTTGMQNVQGVAHNSEGKRKL